MESARRILLIRLGAVGDVVRTMIALGPLRCLAPDAHLSWIAEEAPASVLHDHPQIDEVIVLPRGLVGDMLSEPDTLFPGLALAGQLARELRARRFDLALDFHGTFKSGLVSLASGAPVRWGYAPPGSKEMNRLFNTRHVTLPEGPVHRVERNLALVRALGAPTDGAAVELPIGPAQRGRIDAWLADAGLARARKVLISPGTSRRQAYKRYPAGRLGWVASALSDRTGVSVIVAGGPGEEDLVAELVGGSKGRAIVAPRLDLLELAELIRRCDLFIGPDTGPMHIAWAVGTRVIALFGPTDPALNAPWGEGHRVLYNAPLRPREKPCWPPPEQVALAAETMLAEPSGATRPAGERSLLA